MARVFTTSFSYNEKIYTAVISQIDGSLSIYVPDESLHTILPKGKVTFNPEIGLKIDRPRLSREQHLVLNILTSIELQKTPSLDEVNA